MQQAEQPLPPIQSRQTTSDYSCIVDRFGADSVIYPTSSAAVV